MESVKYWAVSLIAAALIGSIYSFLIPSKSFNSVLKLSVTAFIISVLILPLTSKNNMKELNFESVTDVNTISENSFINETILTYAAENVRKEIETILNGKKYIFEDINITMNIDENSSIVINEVELSGVPDSQKQSLHDYLKKEAGLEVTIKP